MEILGTKKYKKKIQKVLNGSNSTLEMVKQTVNVKRKQQKLSYLKHQGKKIIKTVETSANETVQNCLI